jgi:alginate O-acetyltransferase complex protein AlgI
MYFTDYRFIVFVPLFVVAYWAIGGRLRNTVLLAGAVAWLAYFSPQTLVALAVLTVGIIYPVARLASAARAAGDERKARRRAWIGVALLIAITVGLRLKAYFLTDVVLSSSPLADELLRWIGFSYFLLKGIHVLFATGRGIVTLPSLWTLLQYQLFLPTLTSGPIFRVDAFAAELTRPKRLAWDHLETGLLRILIGLAKKVVVVPILTSWIVALHGRGIALEPPAYVLTYVMLFLDFSGYSDIAVGLGRLFGIVVPENFKSPFTSTTLTQFWRNWHVTLGDWQREHVFIPMGGARARGLQLAGIVLFSMLIVGIWHGFRWIFVGWGVYHGLAMLLENRLGVRPLHAHRAPRWKLYLRYAIVQAIVIGGMFMFIGGPNV